MISINNPELETRLELIFLVFDFKHVMLNRILSVDNI